ncbi:hypothetical protein K504DRAFT_447941 [Pleomassaria siparia CBS 279.74]|uniref:AB hydrolase-1 domain-containing protein n=1 Tax=Pleomassaria siparia CBS 279.74 TaxID=1314801 RepID=A0A6G1K041_9PLEO|nr:hypothetical protein K504DRAFT_447941 [Pleomassaria siparia CBS 279.74]
MSHIKKAYVDTLYGQIHYRHATPILSFSPSEPVIIILPKLASFSISMGALVSYHAPLGYAIYAPDMPYMQMFKAMGTWDKGRGVHLLGHHSGATLALELTNLNPDVVKNVCLAGPSVMSVDEQDEMKVRLLRAFIELVV